MLHQKRSCHQGFEAQHDAVFKHIKQQEHDLLHVKQETTPYFLVVI